MSEKSRCGVPDCPCGGLPQVEKGKHTPGPWGIGEPSEDIQARHTVRGEGGKGFDVAHCFGWRSEANARLIAAAPLLLEAVQRFIALWPVIEPRTEPKATPEVIACWRQAKAALKAAEGED